VIIGILLLGCFFGINAVTVQSDPSNGEHAVDDEILMRSYGAMNMKTNDDKPTSRYPKAS
jgi:hypothetical protein